MSIYAFNDIKSLHLEISSRCNAACPQCARNLYGYPFNDGFVERDLTLNEVKKIFSPGFIGQLRMLIINGNFGDLVMNPESLDIIDYFVQHQHPRLGIFVHTNGGARDSNFWQTLAQHKNLLLHFCIDGIGDVHSLYRQNTLYSTVLQNAQTFIQAGGRAVWKMINFEHNCHQIDQCKQLSQELGFELFDLVDHGRNTGPVFNKQGKLVHFMNSKVKDQFNIDIKQLINKRQTEVYTIKDFNPTIKKISCKAKNSRSIYVDSLGDVYPCCYIGVSPKTYGHGCYMQASNNQFKHFIKENNALEYSLEHCLIWFDQIEQSWSKLDFEQGQLMVCNNTCGI